MATQLERLRLLTPSVVGILIQFSMWPFNISLGIPVLSLPNIKYIFSSVLQKLNLSGEL